MNNVETMLTKSIELVLAVCLLAIATIVVTSVVLRYAFNSSIPGASEWIRILFVYSTAVGAALAIGKREHIAIPFAVESLPYHTQRGIDKLALVAVAVLNAVMIFASLDWIRITGSYLMPTTGLPQRVAQISIPLGCGLAIAFCLFRLLHPIAQPVTSNGASR